MSNALGDRNYRALFRNAIVGILSKLGSLTNAEHTQDDRRRRTNP